MISDGNKGSLKGDCFGWAESSQQRNFDNLCPKIEAEKGVMETDLCRNTSEELFLKAMMETSIGMPVPTMEMLGFKNISQSFRVDSEELFKSWLTNGENHGHNSSGIGHRTRQASKRISTELPSLPGQQHGSTLQKKPSNDLLNTHSPTNDSISSDLNQQSMRNAVERSMQSSNLYLAKAWFLSSQPMTRSRSSELRKRYAAMQGAQTSTGFQATLNVSSLGILKEDLAASTGLNDLPMHDMNNELGSFMSPSNSSSSTFNNLQMGNVDKVSSVVNMLKGTLERKKLGNQNEKEAVDDSSNILYPGYDIAIYSSLDQGNSTHDISGTFHELSAGLVKDPGTLHSVQETFQVDFGGFVNLINPIQTNMYSREPSQSESSAGAPVVSSGLEACDGLTSSSQNLGFCDSSRKQAVNSTRSEPGSRAKDFRERLIDNLKDDRKKGLIRYGSLNSTSSVDKGDPTKKRRVERSRKMAEAKERNSQPAIPSDTQSVLKRCENLEKEVRSLKLNLSFMNRKDSEQTKKIEELQKQNEDLADEKERLLEEIERILSETGRM